MYCPGDGQPNREFTMNNNVQILDENDETILKYEEEEDPDEALFK